MSNEPAQPQSSECHSHTPFSGICIRGTKGCDIIHPEANTCGAASRETCSNPDCPCVAAISNREWTPHTVDELVQQDGYKGIAAAHNAALATERERSKELGEDCDHYYDLLCAEREKLKPLVEALSMLHDDIAEYAAINNLGGFQNHAMKAARSALDRVKEKQ